MHHFLYAARDAWDEAVRLTSWFGLPILIYLALPLTALAAVMSRLRTFKLMLTVTMLIVIPTAMFWNDYGMTLVWFLRHYKSAPPPAPARQIRHGQRFIT